MTGLHVFRPNPRPRTTVDYCDTCGRWDRLRIVRGGRLARCASCLSRHGVRPLDRDEV